MFDSSILIFCLRIIYTIMRRYFKFKYLIHPFEHSAYVIIYTNLRNYFELECLIHTFEISAYVMKTWPPAACWRFLTSTHMSPRAKRIGAKRWSRRSARRTNYASVRNITAPLTFNCCLLKIEPLNTCVNAERQAMCGRSIQMIQTFI